MLEKLSTYTKKPTILGILDFKKPYLEEDRIDFSDKASRAKHCNGSLLERDLLSVEAKDKVNDGEHRQESNKILPKSASTV